jgi:hypothetical protein
LITFWTIIIMMVIAVYLLIIHNTQSFVGSIVIELLIYEPDAIKLFNRKLRSHVKKWIIAAHEI